MVYEPEMAELYTGEWLCTKAYSCHGSPGPDCNWCDRVTLEKKLLAEKTVKITYSCTKLSQDKGCLGTAGADCQYCDKHTITTTRRVLPVCKKYLESLDFREVWQAKGQSGLFYNQAGNEAVPRHSEIHGCNDGGTVRFFIGREQ